MAVANLVLTPLARVQLEVLPDEPRAEIEQALAVLRESPRSPQPANVSRLVTSDDPPMWDLRVGDYHVLFQWDPNCENLKLDSIIRQSLVDYIFRNHDKKQ